MTSIQRLNRACLPIAGVIACLVIGAAPLSGCISTQADNGAATTAQMAADDGIVSVRTIGRIASDGAKLTAIVIEYGMDMAGADVTKASYALDVWQGTWTANSVNDGSGQIGDVTKVYVNDQPAMSSTGGSGSGRYVVIEVYQDYQHATEQGFTYALSAGVTQTGTIKTRTHTITPGTHEVMNYTAGQTGTARAALAGTYTISGLEGFRFYTNTPGAYGASGPSFTALNCYSEQTGTLQAVDMDYALFVPSDYDPSKKYALVTVNHPAFNAGTHPLAAAAQSRGATVMASDWAQNLVKTRHGLAGMIVVVPVYTQRVGDNSGTTAHYSALVKLWDDLQQRYSISQDHIYGAGQSVGGMMILQTNVLRDNYFAGILMYDNQWGQNYYKDEVFARGMTDPTYVETTANTPRYYPSTDDMIWNYHWGSDGSKIHDGHDINNYHFLTSDDNVMVMNSSENFLSNNLWTEQNHLYKDLVDYEIPRLWIMDPHAPKDDQELALRNFLAQPNRYGDQSRGLFWVTFNGGSSQIAPIWSRRLDAAYEWLLSQSRTTAMARTKLDLNKPFELASVQNTNRLMPNFIDPKTGGAIYYPTGKAGAGTRFYNSSWLRIGTNVTADQVPGWLPTGMSHPVTPSTLQNVTPILENGRLTAVALQYDTNMSGAVIRMKGDAVPDSKGMLRTDDFVVMDTYDLRDAADSPIAATTTNIYMSETPQRRTGAIRGSGSGHYVIVEVDSVWNGSTVKVVQRATVRTQQAIASATPIRH
ncbi:hypothetical protein [Pseudaquabacterium rugosum]|uniref:Esterase Ig-like N-terminal domain-containing protein n=1 Tax=Pseudaquabacterium rugosum TaxID=2984194 RepID=A0ABU9BE90_9BURK